MADVAQPDEVKDKGPTVADASHLDKAKDEMVPRDGWDIPRIGAVERAQAHALIAIAEALEPKQRIEISEERMEIMSRAAYKDMSMPSVDDEDEEQRIAEAYKESCGCGHRKAGHGYPNFNGFCCVPDCRCRKYQEPA